MKKTRQFMSFSLPGFRPGHSQLHKVEAKMHLTKQSHDIYRTIPNGKRPVPVPIPKQIPTSLERYWRKHFLLVFQPDESSFKVCIQHCFICRPSDSIVSEDAGIEPRTFALAVKHPYHSARSHPSHRIKLASLLSLSLTRQKDHCRTDYSKPGSTVCL